MSTEQIKKAAQEFIDRQDRLTHPDGKFDNAKRWWPSDDEECTCCGGIRSPSRSWPYSLMIHCRTAQHVAALFDVDARELKREARRLRQAGGAK